MTAPAAIFRGSAARVTLFKVIARQVFAAILCGGLCLPAIALTDSELGAVQSGFDTRRDNGIAALKSYFEKHKGDANRDPLMVEAPASAGGTRTSAYASSVGAYALTVMWTNDEPQLPKANAALLKMLNYFIRNRDARDGVDNFYWWTSQLTQTINLFGSHGIRAKGRLDSATEDAAYELMWIWAKENSKSDEATIHDDYWYVWGSENHHVKRFVTCWSFSLLLSKDARYRDRRYDDGQNVVQHLNAWTAFAKDYLSQRARRGLFIEAGSQYNVDSLRAIYDLYDLSDDAELKRRAGSFLTLYWASWAEEQIDGVQGGGKAREYLKWGLGGNSVLEHLSWFYFGMGKELMPESDDGEIVFLLSDYRVPAVVLDIALDVKNRGSYEIRQWPLGLALHGYNEPPNYRIDIKGGRLLRYSYCTPSFILGTMMEESRPETDWAEISAQNRWQGVIFSGDIDARIFPVPAGIDGAGKIDKSASSYNSFWSVQSKGALITQKLKTGLHVGPMRVWFSHAGLSERGESEGWVFTVAPGAYAAIRIVSGASHWQADDKGDWLVSDDEFSPIIMEVAQKSDFADFKAFRQKVQSHPVQFKDKTLEYTSLAGDSFTFYADYRQPPRINGKPVDYAPPQASLRSPFVNADWNSGVVSLKKDARHVTLDFNGSAAANGTNRRPPAPSTKNAADLH